MQTGICFWFGYPITTEKRLKLIADAGFDSVFSWWGDQYIEIDGSKETFPELARNAGLSIENIHTDTENANLLWLDKLGWEDLMKRYLSTIDACCKYQIPTMVLHLTSGFEPPSANVLGIDRIKRLVERAEQKNVNIALENLKRPDYLDFIFQSIYSDRLKFCYDSGHDNCYSKNGDILDRFGHKLISLHLHDNDGLYDQHRLPGEGNIVWKEIANKLKQHNYAGSISLEVTSEYSDKYINLSAEQFLLDAYHQADFIRGLCE